MKVWISVTLKPDVLDPEGVAIRRAAVELGHASVGGVRQGKLFEIELEESDEGRARALALELADKLLANPVIENFEIVRMEP
jgi:phosphoribosylformylglycinamidine synthase